MDFVVSGFEKEFGTEVDVFAKGLAKRFEEEKGFEKEKGFETEKGFNKEESEEGFVGTDVEEKVAKGLKNEV